jgi:hypothetical protein
MTVKVRIVATAELGELEALINETLSQPASKGFELATAFPSPDGENIVLVFQKP